MKKAYDVRWIKSAIPALKNILCYARYSIVQKLSNKQSVKVICRLRIAHSKRQTNHISLKNLSAAHTFHYIMLRVKPGLTSCEDLATTLTMHAHLATHAFPPTYGHMYTRIGHTHTHAHTHTHTHTHIHTHTHTYTHIHKHTHKHTHTHTHTYTPAKYSDLL